MVKELREKKEKKILNELASDLTSADFKPSADQIKTKFRNIVRNAKTGTKTKAGLSHEPPLKRTYLDMFVYLITNICFGVLLYNFKMSFLLLL